MAVGPVEGNGEVPFPIVQLPGGPLDVAHWTGACSAGIPSGRRAGRFLLACKTPAGSFHHQLHLEDCVEEVGGGALGWPLGQGPCPQRCQHVSSAGAARSPAARLSWHPGKH